MQHRAAESLEQDQNTLGQDSSVLMQRTEKRLETAAGENTQL
jgi:hypothetical protein